MLLLLFDIDGTMLLKASAEHAASIHAALREVHGIADPAAAGVAAAGAPTARSRVRSSCATASAQSGSTRAPPTCAM